jgi:hypothetical protein
MGTAFFEKNSDFWGILYGFLGGTACAGECEGKTEDSESE